MKTETCSDKNGNAVKLADAKSELKNNGCIDKSTIRYKIHFILGSGAQGLITPCIAVFAKNRIHLSPASFALLVMTHQFLLILAKPAIGYIVDYFNKLRATIVTLTLIYMASICLLLIIPPIPKQIETSHEEVRLKLQDVCQLNRIVDNSTSMHTNSTLLGEEKNCTVHLETFMNASKAETSDSYQTSEAIDAFPTAINEICHELITCEHVYQVFNITKEICHLCCENSEECLSSSVKYFDNEVTKIKLKENNDNDFQYYQFWLFAILYIALFTCENSTITLTDTALCEAVEQLGKDFGKERVWGALGFGLFAPLGGYLDDLTGGYLATTTLSVVMMLFMLVNIAKIDMAKPHTSPNILKDLGTVVKSKSFVYFFFASVANGFGYGIVWYYLMWHVVSIGGDRLICGLVHAIQCCAGEVPFMFCADWIIRKIGYFHTTSLALLASCGRFFWYSQVQNPWLILTTEWTHGITYGLFYTAMFTFSKTNGIPGTEATTSSIMLSGYSALGSGLGNVVAGVGFSCFGGHQTFFYGGVFFGFCVVLNMCYTIYEKFRTKVLIIQKATIQTIC